MDDVDIYDDLMSALPTNLAPSTNLPQPSSEVNHTEGIVDNADDADDTARESDGTESSSEEGDVPDVLFEQVTASTTPVDSAAKRRHIGVPSLHRLEPTLFLGAPPHLSLHADNAANYVAVSGLNWWISDAKLRQKAEQAAPCRHVRILDRADNGKSHGIGVLEFTNSEGAQKALYSLPEILRIGALKPIPISPEFLAEARRPSHVGPSWLEGGPITTDLLLCMQALFGPNLFVKPVPQRLRPALRLRPRADTEPWHGPDIALPAETHVANHAAVASMAGAVTNLASMPTLSLTPLPSASASPNIWASKLEKLRQNVNKKNSSPDSESDAKRRRR